jgi:hypothetical protein
LPSSSEELCPGNSEEVTMGIDEALGNQSLGVAAGNQVVTASCLTLLRVRVGVLGGAADPGSLGVGEGRTGRSPNDWARSSPRKSPRKGKMHP